MLIIGQILAFAIDIYMTLIIVQVALSWLIAFDVINAGNRKAQNLIGLLQRATDPIYKPLQRVIPPLGGIDITPLIVILGLSLIKNQLIIPIFFGY